MNPDSPRTLAARVLTAVWQDGRYLDEALRAAAAGRLTARDAALLQELCYGSLRFQPRLEFWLGQLLTHPLKSRDRDVQALLLLGLYQLTEMRVPEHAAIGETVEACRQLGKPWATRVVNAVLRRFQRERARLLAELPQHPTACYAHPRWLLERLQADWPRHWQAVMHANNEHPPLTLRVNRLRTSRAALAGELAASGIATRGCEFSGDGLIAERPFEVTASPAFSAGKFSVQDEAAQLAAGLLEVQAGMRVLDACAAPGGKTGHVLESCPGVSLAALDSDAARAQKIQQNLQRLGLSAEIRVADAAAPATWWDGRRFDRILLDAPCSATGVIRRHPDIKCRRQPADVVAAVDAQERLLAALWPLLAPGGKLLYATCSVLAGENEDQMRRFLEIRPDARAVTIPAAWGMATGCGRQLLPGDSGMDGFYYALLQKPGAERGA